MDENKFSFENEEYRRTYWHTCSHILALSLIHIWVRTWITLLGLNGKRDVSLMRTANVRYATN